MSVSSGARPGGNRLRIIRRRLKGPALGLLSGALLALPFLFPLLWWVAYAALVPWIFLLTRADSRASYLYFFLGALVFFAMALSPFALFHVAVPYALALFYAPFLLPFAILLRTIYRRRQLPLTFLVPVGWVATEWLRLRFSVGQVAIFPLGTSQFEQLILIQIADITGVAGVSFVVACGSGAIADLVLRRGPSNRSSAWPATLFPLLLGGVLVYGAVRQTAVDLVEGPRVALVQPNVTHFRDPARARAVFDEQLEFTRDAIAAGDADLVVLPENAVSVPIGDEPEYREQLGELAQELEARVVVGAFSRASLVPPRVYTSAYYVSSQGELVGRYHKLHLIPWAEYLPFEGWLPRVSRGLAQAQRALTRQLLGYESNGVAGDELVLFSFEGAGRAVDFAVPICFEVASSEFARHAVDSGADFLLNITSEGVFGPSIYWHMLAHSVLRAVENRAAVVRAGNNGISGIIEPSGRVRSLVAGEETGRPYLEPGTLVDRVPLNRANAGSFFTRHGDLFAYLCVGLCLVLFAFASFARREPKESSAAGISSSPNP